MIWEKKSSECSFSQSISAASWRFASIPARTSWRNYRDGGAREDPGRRHFHRRRLGQLLSLHVVRSRNIPPGNDFAREDKALDIVNINGMIVGGRVHAHIAFSDIAKSLGGHLEPGCVVLTFTALVIGVIDEDSVDLSRWDKYDVMNN